MHFAHGLVMIILSQRSNEMIRETIKEYILQVKSQDGTEALYNRWEPDIDTYEVEL